MLSTNVGQFGVTEGELIAFFMHLITGVKGQGFWAIQLLDVLPNEAISLIPPELLEVVAPLKLGGVVCYSVGGLMYISSVYIFLKTVFNTGHLLKPFKEWFTILTIIGMELLWYRLSLFNEYQGLFLMNFGLMSSLIACKLIISSVTKVVLFRSR